VRATIHEDGNARLGFARQRLRVGRWPAGMRRSKQRYAVLSMCIGSGMDAAGLFERER
jgi:hypothetical protein